MVLGIALFKFRSLNKDVLSRLFPQKNRRISFHKSADFLNAFFHSYLCPPAFRYFLSFILPFSVLFRPPSPAFSSNRLFSCRRFKNRPPLLLQKYNRRPPNSFFTPRKLPAIPLCKPPTSSRKSRGAIRPLRLPERRYAPLRRLFNDKFFRAPSLPENNLKKYFYYILKIC